MFGYIRPLKGELKVQEFERFKACYCGLCHSLGKKYGTASRFILNFELVFLAMLLWDENDKIAVKRGRCIANPFRKKPYCRQNPALDKCAGYSVILSWWKLKDTVADEGFFKSLPARAYMLILRRAYKKAAAEFREFDESVRRKLYELAEYESSGEASIDGAADKFAQILSAAVGDSTPENKRRPMAEFLYHMGRWIYITDACDDYEKDVVRGRYNPVALRFPPVDGKLPDDGAEKLKTTLDHSNNLISAAYELMPENAWAPVLRNTIYLGMPETCRCVMNGTWQQVSQRNIRRTD